MPKANKLIVADLLRQWRRSQGLTQRRAAIVLADRTGFPVAFSTYQRWETGKNAIMDYKFAMLVDAINADAPLPDPFLDEEEEEEEEEEDNRQGEEKIVAHTSLCPITLGISDDCECEGGLGV